MISMRFALLSLLALGACYRAVLPAGPVDAGPPPSMHHLLFEVRNLEASLVFYQHELGLRLLSKHGDFAMLKARNMGVYLWQGHQAWEAPLKAGEPRGRGLYPRLDLQDVGGAVEQLGLGGVRIVQPARSYDWGDEAFVADPDGYVWALVHMREGAP